MTPVIRPAGPPDAALLAALHGRAHADRPWTVAEHDALLRRLDVAAVLAAVDGAPVAFAVTSLAAGEAELYEIAVDPAWRRRGIGRQLLEDVMDRLRRQGAAALHLEVAEDNHAARALYVALGFAESGRRRAYYTHGPLPVDAVTMTRHLSL